MAIICRTKSRASANGSCATSSPWGNIIGQTVWILCDEAIAIPLEPRNTLQHSVKCDVPMVLWKHHIWHSVVVCLLCRTNFRLCRTNFMLYRSKFKPFSEWYSLKYNLLHSRAVYVNKSSNGDNLSHKIDCVYQHCVKCDVPEIHTVNA